ncbi:hypothetical protein BBP40_011164 [Aspergillus hancockii]|nr:hypothetical protein BBP40_011164 [Aspergillus hancockii]
MVYAAELKGIQMALVMVRKLARAGESRWRERAARGIHIFSDIQPPDGLGARYFSRHASSLRADELAKAAAVRGPLPIEEGQLIRLAVAAKGVVREQSKMDWVQAWKKKTSRQSLVQAPGPQVLRYWKGFRNATSVLIQLRTGRTGLNQYLTRINVRQDAR